MRRGRCVVQRVYDVVPGESVTVSMLILEEMIRDIAMADFLSCIEL